ncbi:cytochrome c heme lyase [Fistulina hepatica ATCC 64428]|uniref:Holocytochrome c-type synthase n=1 Tax=Fistulina hepatica ATCC 64428 TaxID=1128425 RepID=A0A0D7AKU6_9AGAR|nr:cytochrome c heme lyase [Fistulina hepatica ATCC 64428]
MGQSQSQSLPACATGCPVPQNSAPSSSSDAAKCPIDHTQFARKRENVDYSSRAKCPIDHDTPARCPIDHESLNPLNQMPTLSQAPAFTQSTNLPTERTISSIPRDKTGSRWEYPSPQQFYNALVRKGWETPEEHVGTMVDIHNFLNEQAWEEVLKWERRSSPDAENVELARFRGRPGEMSPKARFWMLAGWLLPARFNSEPPFDRHDWIVRRPKTGEEVRYVIDYYSAPPEPDGAPVFSLDVRPALDSFTSVRQRLAVATEETWTSFREKRSMSSPLPPQQVGRQS